jgi:multiple antibiotic resistance protein
MTEEARGLVQGVFLVVAALFPIVNPLGNAPLFLALTTDMEDAQRMSLARKVAINGFFLLCAAIFFGDYVLDFFGISVPVVQLAGGLVVASLGWIGLRRSADEKPAPRAESESALEAKAFYPLTLPMTVGPGSISVAITLGANFPSTVQPFINDAVSAVIGAFLVCLSTFLCFAFAERLSRSLGPSGLAVVLRLSSFILLCIGVQIMWNGADALFGFSKMHP